MVQIKLSVAFVLAAAAIAPVVAQPIFVERMTSSTNSPTGKDAHSSAKVLEAGSKVANLEPEVTVGNNSKFKVEVDHLHDERKLKVHEHQAANRHRTPRVHTLKERLHKKTNSRHKNLHKQGSKHELNLPHRHSEDHKATIRSRHHQLFDETLFKERLKLKTDMSAIPKVARGDSEMFERSFDDSDLEGRQMVFRWNHNPLRYQGPAGRIQFPLPRDDSEMFERSFDDSALEDRELVVHFNSNNGHYQGPAGHLILPPPPPPRPRDDSEIFERSPRLVESFNLHVVAPGANRGPGIGHNQNYPIYHRKPIKIFNKLIY